MTERRTIKRTMLTGIFIILLFVLSINSFAADDGAFTVTIPTEIRYDNMNVGAVSESNAFYITVGGTYKGRTVIVNAETSSVSIKNGNESITATAESGKNHLEFSTASTMQDTISLSGEAKTTGEYTGSVTYIASTKNNSYTVSYNKGNADGGWDSSKYSSQKVTYPNTVSLHTNQMTKSDVTVYRYTVTYNAAGGTVSPASATATTVKKYTANGWTTTSGSQTQNYKDRDPVVPTENIVLYPCFSESVTGGSVALPTPTREGYTFSGWKCSTDNKTYAAGSTFVPNEDVTMTAIWNVNSYTVTRRYRLQKADGNYDSYVQIDSKKYDNGTKVSAWNRTADDTYKAASIPEYTVGTKDDTLSVNVDRNTATNTIQYRLQNADGTYGSYTNGWSGTLRVGESYTWSRNADSTYKAASKSVTGTKSVQTVQVNVDRVTYTVQFNSEGGSAVSSVSKLAGNTIGTLPTPTKSGYSFAGWYTAASGGIKISNTTTMPAENVIYYAHWTRNKAELTKGIEFNEKAKRIIDGSATKFAFSETAPNTSVTKAEVQSDDSGYKIYVWVTIQQEQS